MKRHKYNLYTMKKKGNRFCHGFVFAETSEDAEPILRRIVANKFVNEDYSVDGSIDDYAVMLIPDDSSTWEREYLDHVPLLDYQGNLLQPEAISLGRIAKILNRDNLPVLLGDMANNMGNLDNITAGKQVGEKLRYQHRTLQACIVNLLLGILVGMSEQEYTDARNEVAIKTCKRIAEMLESGELGVNAFI